MAGAVPLDDLPDALRGTAVPDDDLPGAKPAAPRKQLKGVSGIPGVNPEWLAGTTPAQNPPSYGAMDYAKAFGETGLALATGATSGLVTGIDKLVQHTLRFATGQPAEHADAEQAFMAGARAGTFEPRTPLGREMTATTGEALATHGPSLIGIGPELAMLGRTIKPAARAVGDAARAGAAKAIPTISPEMATLVQKADTFGISLRPDQVSSNKLVKMAGEASASVPLSGSKNAQNQKAFDIALLKQLDPETKATAFTRAEYAKAMNKSGNTIGTIAEKAKIPLDEPLIKNLSEHLSDVATETPEVRGVNEAWVKKILDAAADGKEIPGPALRKLDSQLGRQMKTTPDGDLRRTLTDVHEILMDSLERNVGAKDMKTFTDARRQYAIGKAIEPVVAKDGYTGHFPPPQLMGRLTSNAAGKRFMAMDKGGAVGDLADVGQLLKEPASSGTAERRLAYGVLSAAGGAVGGAGATAGAGAAGAVAGGAVAPIYAGANLYNRAGPTLTRAMAAKSLPGQPAAAQVAPAMADPSLALGFEPPLQARVAPSPLGDLTPDWQTLLGAAPEPPVAGISGAGLTPALGDPAVTTGYRPTRPKPQQPVAPGKPGLPDTIVVGRPKEAGATEATGAAMQTPEAALARQLQEVERLKRDAPPEVVNTLDAHAKTVAGLLKAETDAKALETAASQATDAGIKEALLKRALEIREKAQQPAK